MNSDKDASNAGLAQNETENATQETETRDIPELDFNPPPEDDYGTNGDDITIRAEDDESAQDNTSIATPPQRTQDLATPDDTLSVQDSVLSSPRRPRLGTPGHSFRPFDRRFSARLSPSPLATPRPSSPAFLTGGSRRSSALNPFFSSESGDSEVPEAPWEVFRWTKLRKLSGDAFSELGKRNYGRPACMAVASLIAVGTSKGLILIFDYHQNLKTTIGLGTKAVESGSITAIALSADHTIVAGGHANGDIFTWEIARPAKPFLHIPAGNAVKLQELGIDGHIMDASVLHLGFLGTRHTALVSADVRGMAFSHLATRGLGAIARSVKTARILGRYPELQLEAAKPRKPSSVLAFSSLPLGNSESPIDVLGLVAILTPYLLVVVSTTPVAQTQHKASRPKKLTMHGALTGTLAWYPAMKGKSASSNPKLAYCWLNVVTIIEVVDVPNEVDKDAPPDLNFKHLNQWSIEESIVAMQWLNRSVLAILTISQQLIVLEDSSLAVTDSSDLIRRHVYHVDSFSQQLSYMIENLEQDDNSIHGVVADAFYMSFKAYKGRLFLLGFDDISIGTLSNWADRLLALMEQGDFIGAIQLATSYYRGGPEQAAIGLPMDEESRHALVRGKLFEIMSASLRYVFGKNVESEARLNETQLQHLAEACFTACLQLQDADFLFDEMYTWYSENKSSQIFLDILESRITEGLITTVPPAVLKDLVNSFVDRSQNSNLETILCLLDPATMDLEQVTLLCRKFKLYDALFYIWSQAIGDYTTVLKNLLAQSQNEKLDQEHEEQSKIFPYLSYILTGRIYPLGERLPEDKSFRAKAEVYHFLFSGSAGQSYTHLRQALDLDASSFMSMLNEAFEDSFLDGNTESVATTNGYSEEERFAISLTRQYIIRVLLEILVPPDYELEDIIYLDMFIARNQAKFPQFIRLPGNILQKVMVDLCLYPSEEAAEDCQLSLEYLLSVYQPPDVTSLLPELEKAKFWRVMKTIYKSENQYSRLLETCLKDIENAEETFQCIEDCLREGSDLTAKQREDFRGVLLAHGKEFLCIDLVKASKVVDQLAPNLHVPLLQAVQDQPRAQFEYLQQIMEQGKKDGVESHAIYASFQEQYIQLLCEFDPHHVSDYINGLDSSNLRLDRLLPALEQSGVIDAAVMLMAKEGQARTAMERLVQHLKYLEVALNSLFEGAALAPDLENTTENASDLVDSVEKYSKVGIWLCNLEQNQHSDQLRPPVTKRMSRIPSSRILDSPLDAQESLWLDLIDAVVRVARNSNIVEEADQEDDEQDTKSVVRINELEAPLDRLRNVVQDTFTALLAATSASSRHGGQSNIHFLKILRAFLTRISESSPSLVHLRAVLSSIFSAYAYEENLLTLSNRLLDKDLFVHVEEAVERRKKGWRPSGQTCNGCGRRVWGPGTGADAWQAWYDRQNQEVNGIKTDVGETTSKKGKGKEPITAPPNNEGATAHGEATKIDEQQDQLVVFSCRHIWHRGCLKMGTQNGRLQCPLEETAVQ